MRRLSAVLLLLWCAPCRASLVTVQVSGVIDRASFRDDHTTPDPFRFTVGESFRLTFGYDPQAPGFSVGDPANTYFLAPALPNELTTSTGFRASFTEFTAVVGDGADSDSLDLTFSGAGAFTLRFAEATGSVLTSDALPDAATLLRFGAPRRTDYTRVFGPDNDPDFTTFGGPSTLSVASVPEPGTLATAGLGLVLAGMGWAWGRKRHRPA